MKLGMLQFLRPRRGEVDGDRVLVVQSGAMSDAVRVVQALRERTPDSAFSLLVRRGADAALPPLPGVEILQNQAANAEWVRRLQRERFDRVYVLLTGEPIPWKLKLLPFLLGAGVVYAVNENLDWFEVSTREPAALAHHLRFRLESSLTHAGPGGSGPARLARVAAYPAVLAYLVAWERLRTRAARRRGAPEWKRERDLRPAQASSGRDAAPRSEAV